MTRRIPRWCALVAIVAMGLLLYVVAPDHSWWMPKCPMKLLTGLSCPGCGIQRALHAALHGEWGRAVAYNYYLIYALPYALSVFVAWLLPDGPRRDRLRGIVENRWAVGFFVVSYMVWLVVRNILNI